ncbi:hypothetical protein L6R49_25500 [Myxococcota bacterium]|nr:hypothetical protein [Myxococcota bacterium]
MPSPLGLALLLAAAGSARAEEPTIEFVRGASMTAGRVVGMGGVAVGVGDGARAQLYNPAASTRRRAAAWGRPLDTDGTLALVNNPYVTRDNRSNNLGEEAPPDWLLAGSGTLRWRQLAVGGNLLGQSYTTLGDDLSLRQVTTTVNVAGIDARGLVSWGLAASWQETRLLAPRVDGAPRELRRRAGTPGLAAGLLLTPPGRSTRLGLAGSLPSNADAVAVDADAPLSSGDFAGVHTPWTFTLGLAHRLGPSPWNLTPTYAGGVEASARPRLGGPQALILGVDLGLIGPARGAMSAGQLASGAEPGEATLSFAPRAGAELELGDLIKLRCGAYWEPGRFDPAAGRLHATTGGDLRLPWLPGWGDRDLRVTLSLDGGRDTVRYGLGVGLW